MLPRTTGTVPALTNPLSIYRSLIATNKIDPDPSQHRLAIHLQKLYFRLIDYSPQVQYAERLNAIYRVAHKSSQIEDDKQLAAPGHPLRRNPLFARFFSKKDRQESLALTRVLTSYEEAINLQSPQGLLVHGEVGSGKSMLVDLLADGLPNRKKRRWHFNTFMLEVLARLEQFRRSRCNDGQDDANSEHSLLLLAKDMIDESAILFLDEFQLPDKAASKILSQLLTAFFHLGGVLIATSNRMPDELSKASGVDFANYPRDKIASNFLGLGGRNKLTTSYTNQEYAGFVEVLKARCEIWNMEGERDWRRREAENTVTWSSNVSSELKEKITLTAEQAFENTDPSRDKEDPNIILPKNYLLKSPESDEAWQSAIRSSLELDTNNPITWEKKDLLVYAREVLVPRHFNGVAHWTFSELCGSFLGPADYITLASTFHTFILDEVPIVTVLQKNEARRFITLLDALYEARCKLLIRAEAGPDDIFFPEISSPIENSSQPIGNESSNAVYSETLSEIYQDQVLPFRPNISAYTDGIKSTSKSDISLNIGQSTTQNNGIEHPVNFSLTGSFTGEDERFAYKRARSRLWEMCGAKWHARSDSGWWQPLPVKIRRWERSTLSTPTINQVSHMKNDVEIGDFTELDSPAGLQGIELKREAACTGSCSKHSEPSS
ncbi:hypothetical protein K3495_g6290 [Podosphaera aphanis]|nr:hypothetical protein K3495_g6290 [Podosphaera aphanis]